MAQVFDLSRDRLAASDPLAERLTRAIEGEVRFDRATRGRYSTDASIYQIVPRGVAVPRSIADLETTLGIAREEGVPVTARGGGTSQAGQTIGQGLIIDNSKYLDQVSEFDADARTAWVEPGIVLDDLNRRLKASGLWFPVDISTSSRATIGGMAANNSCGSRSLRYGIMADNVLAIEGILADGERVTFEQVPGNLETGAGSQHYLAIIQKLRAIAAGNADDIRERFARLRRRVGGYNLDSIDPAGHNMARLVIGSEGTLAYFTRIKLALQPLPKHKVLGICHFPSFRQAMEAAQHIVPLGPTAVELVDRSILVLAEAIPAFRELLPRFVRGQPQALLLVEFAGDEPEPQVAALRRLEELMCDLGLPDSVVRVTDAAQSEVWEIRTAGLNIAMSMKGDGKPVSFIEDCAVPLAELAEYTERLNEVFARHGTSATWYAHASEGCLHVRPILNLKQEQGVRAMRQIAEAAFAMVREYKGSHSGEHGDGLVRSEFHEAMFGSRLVRAFGEVKNSFDPNGLLNPGKIVRASRMDDRSLLRYPPGYEALPLDTGLDWSAWGGFLGAAEMCNNNGACRKAVGGVMCPSFRLMHDEQHVTRGRANTLRLALSGQLGADALTSDALYEALELCVSCKGCKRECPTGVDMARMKIEVLHHRSQRHGIGARQRLVGYLPRYAPYVAPFAPFANLRNHWSLAARLGERFLGFSAKRSLPPWQRKPYRPDGNGAVTGERAVLLFADTFNTWFEPGNARAAERVLRAAGFRVLSATPPGERPLCCGRTFLSAGLVDQARAEARRTLDALQPWLEQGLEVVGLEPSCLFTFRDELGAILPGAQTGLLSERALLLEEFLMRNGHAQQLRSRLRKAPWDQALLHGHCHQKAFGAMGTVETALRLVPELEVETIESSCCGMAGAFGYEAEHYEASMGMAERNLLPAVRCASQDSVIVADGTSCRHQIKDGAGRDAVHVAGVLAAALA